jgi:hypothetical protein
MNTESWVLGAAGWLAILTGSVVAIFGIVVVTMAGRDSHVVAGGPVMFAIFIAPAIAVVGVTVIVCGFKLMGGHLWARVVLEVFSWITLCASIGAIVYSGSTLRQIDSEDIIQGAFVFLTSGLPALIMIILLHSAAVARAVSR